MNRNVTTIVTTYIKGRSEELVTVAEAVADTGLTPEQVRYAMRRLIEKTALSRHIKVVSRGHAWQIGAVPGARKKAVEVVPVPPAPAKEADTLLIEMVGKLGDGTDVVKTPNGNLWKLLPL